MTKTKTKLINFWQIVKRSNGLMLFSLILLLMTMLISTNYANSQSLERNELSKKLQAAEDSLRLSNADLGRLQATERLELESQRLNLVRIQTQDIYYLNAGRDLVALK